MCWLQLCPADPAEGPALSSPAVAQLSASALSLSSGPMVYPLAEGVKALRIAWLARHLMQQKAENKGTAELQRCSHHSSQLQKESKCSVPQAWLVKPGFPANPVSLHHLEPWHYSISPCALSWRKTFISFLNKPELVVQLPFDVLLRDTVSGSCNVPSCFVYQDSSLSPSQHNKSIQICTAVGAPDKAARFGAAARNVSCQELLSVFTYCFLFAGSRAKKCLLLAVVALTSD